MASITIRNLEEHLKTRLRKRAARHGWSMAKEARRILRKALRQENAPAGNLYEAIHGRFAKYGGVELELPPREPIRQPPKLGKPRRR